MTLFFKYVARPGVGVRTVKRDKNCTPVVKDSQVCFLAAARVKTIYDGHAAESTCMLVGRWGNRRTSDNISLKKSSDLGSF